MIKNLLFEPRPRGRYCYVTEEFFVDVFFSNGFGYSIEIGSTIWSTYHYFNPPYIIESNGLLNKYPSYTKYLEGTPWEIK